MTKIKLHLSILMFIILSSCEDKPIIIYHIVPIGYEGLLLEVFDENAPPLEKYNGNLVINHKSYITKYSTPIYRSKGSIEYYIPMDSIDCSILDTIAIKEGYSSFLKLSHPRSGIKCDKGYFYTLIKYDESEYPFPDSYREEQDSIVEQVLCQDSF